MKKLLATILALVMALSVTTISWADEEGAEGGETAGLLDVVYVNTSTGDDTNGTGAETSPVKYLKKAMTLVKEGGIIRVTGQTTVNPFWGNQNPDKTIAGGNYYVTKSVTIEGYGEEGMHDLHGIALPSDFGGKLTLRNIDFDGSGAIGIYNGGIASTAEITIDNCRFNKAGGNCVYIAPHITKLEVKNCKFTAAANAENQYLIWTQAGADTVIITDNNINVDGENKAKCAIHLGDGSTTAMNAAITGNKISGVKRGIQIAFATGKNDTVTIDKNTFTDVTEGAVILHENMAAQPTAKITYGTDNTLAGTTTKGIVAKVSDNGTTYVDVAKVVVPPTGTELVKNADGSYSVVKKPAPSYYYHPTTDTKADETKGSPKTFDAGIGIYAVTAVLSVTGMAWTAKKRH